MCTKHARGIAVLTDTYLYPWYRKPYVLCRDRLSKSCRPLYRTPANHAGMPRHTIRTPGTPSSNAVQKWLFEKQTSVVSWVQ